MRRRLAAENGPSRGRGTSILVASIMRVAKSPLTKIVTICQHLGRSRQSKALSSVHCRCTSHNGAVVAVCLLRGAPFSYEPSFYTASCNYRGGGMRRCNLQRTCAAARHRLKSPLGSAVEAGHWCVRRCPLTASQPATSAAIVTFLDASHSYLDTQAKDWSVVVSTADSAPPARQNPATTTCTSPPVFFASTPARPSL